MGPGHGPRNRQEELQSTNLLCGATVFLILLAISVVGLFWSLCQADRLDGERHPRRTLVCDDDTMVGNRHQAKRPKWSRGAFARPSRYSG